LEILRNTAPGPDDENYLWRQLLQGDKTALARIMHCYTDSLFNYGTRFSTDKPLVEDCIQDLFIEIWKRKESLATTVHLKSYLFSSLRRMVLRKNKGLKKVRIISLGPDEFNGFNCEFSIDHTIIKHEESRIIAQKLQQMITALPKRQKEIVYLKFFENLDREGIGDIMQISPQAVSNLLQKALKKLRAGSDIITFAITALLCLGLLHNW
jgi:RNA polymerase sigma factor (sigma-70 family)